MNDFDKGIIDAGKLLKRGYAAIEGSISKIIALITGALAILLTFAEIAPPNIVTAALGVDLAVMLISSYVIYFSLEDAGERLGRESEEYKHAKERHRTLVGKIESSMIEPLTSFLARYRIEEHKYRLITAMTLDGITEQELTAYRAGEKFDKRRTRSLKRIASIKPIDISVHTLLGGASPDGDGAIRNPKKGKLARLIIKLIPSTLCLLFTVSMMITAKDGIDAGGVISGIVKLSTLPIIGLKGYSTGYLYATESESEWLEARSRLIEAFLEKASDDENKNATM